MNRKPLLQYFLVALLSFTLATVNVVPVKADSAQNLFPSFERFVNAVKNGQANVARGVYVDNTLALRIIQQPINNPAYVSSITGVASQFRAAAGHGTIGLLAHNYLSGALFFNLTPGQEVKIVYGDGRVEIYIINAIYHYQALDPQNVASDFIDLDTNVTLSATALFEKFYGGERDLTFQTCIARNGNLSWGRIFVVATAIT